jgi:signal transduction histidine kinase
MSRLAYESGPGTRQTRVLEAGIHRIAQEALGNAVSHAEASRLWGSYGSTAAPRSSERAAAAS